MGTPGARAISISLAQAYSSGMPERIRDEQAVLAHYEAEGARLNIGGVELVALEQTIRIDWMPLILQVRVSSTIVDMDFPPEVRPALLEAVNAANSAIGYAVFHLPMALFAKHVLFMEDDRSLSSSVLDRSLKLVAEAARGFGPQLRAIAAGSLERIPTLQDTARKVAQLWADEMNNATDED